mmetsp:Transcript_13345/g.42621  ORF Transcript_13345/g.42621 Transcript_13345/m.42621 type:complete len:249 (-) Transcript_13345:344-1090(-)
MTTSHARLIRQPGQSCSPGPERLQQHTSTQQQASARAQTQADTGAQTHGQSWPQHTSGVGLSVRRPSMEGRCLCTKSSSGTSLCLAMAPSSSAPSLSPSWVRPRCTSTCTSAKAPTRRSRSASRSTRPGGKTQSPSPACSLTGWSQFTTGRPADRRGSRSLGVWGAVGTWQTEPIHPPKRLLDRRKRNMDCPPPWEVPMRTTRSLRPCSTSASWSTSRSRRASALSIDSTSKMSSQDTPPALSVCWSG